MPIDYAHTILLGDSDPERAEFLIDILKNNFGTEVVRAQHFDELNDRVVEAIQATSSWKLVLIAVGLPESQTQKTAILPQHFFSISSINKDQLVGCIYTNVKPPDLGWHLLAFSIPDANEEIDQRRTAVINVINDARIPKLRARAEAKFNVDDDPILAEQLTALGDAKSAHTILAYLLGDFHRKDESLIVSRLIQGASGSIVIRFAPESPNSQTRERVLKIVHYTDEWKLREEIEKHVHVQESFGEYALHVPKIETFDMSGVPQHITRYDNWRAISYDFLGPGNFKKGQNRLGKFMDLGTALVAAPNQLREKTIETRFDDYFESETVCENGRKRFLEMLLTWLADSWYCADSIRREMVLWDYSPGPDNGFETFPPYRLPRRRKRWILNFLDSRLCQMGSRICDQWEHYRQTVRDFVAGEPANLNAKYSLATSHSLLLSPSHGDLNSNNILVWLDEAEHPFLIDLPFYQDSGHALQDFARLEVEVKFLLMDQQLGSPQTELPAFDYTHSQFRGWQALEDSLLTEPELPLKLPADCFADNIRLSRELVDLIRLKARAVQQQHQDKVTIPFWTEYRPALVYHTLQTIAFDSLSPFKRILAVYSSARLLEQCRPS